MERVFTECACWGCVEENLYSRMYCQDCFDMGCGDSNEDMH